MNKRGIISFAEWGIENIGEDFLNKYWDYKKNKLDPYKISYGSHKKVWIKCQEKEYHDSYEILCNSFTSGQRCPYCSHNGGKCHKLDSLGYLYPKEAEAIVLDKRNNITMNDLYEIPPNSTKRFYVVDTKCGKGSSKKKLVYKIIRGIYCEYCSDGVSIPEKFVSSVLSQLNIDCIKQYNLYWSNNRKYDFYIPNLNMIIETHGGQHYNECNLTKRTLKEELENDNLKKELALKNGIENYIIIDCRHSTLEWLKENVIKELGNLFNLNNINWEEIWLNCQNSLVIQAVNLWNKGLSVNDIANELKYNKFTIIRYLKQGYKIGLCDYTTETSCKRGYEKNKGRGNPRAKFVICLTTNKIFDTIEEGAKYYNVCRSSISQCCNGKLKSAGRLSNGTKLVWKWLIWKHNKKLKMINNNK